MGGHSSALEAVEARRARRAGLRRLAVGLALLGLLPFLLTGGTTCRVGWTWWASNALFLLLLQVPAASLAVASAGLPAPTRRRIVLALWLGVGPLLYVVGAGLGFCP